MQADNSTNNPEAGEPVENAAGRQLFLRSGWFVLFFFLVVTAAFLWPQVTHMATTLPDGLDSTDTARQLGDIARNLLHNPLHIYDSPGLYPLSNDLALNELLIAQGIVFAPIVWLTGNPVLAWNIVTFTSFLLSALAAFLLVRLATGSILAGLAAGIIYSFSPWHYGQYGHLGIVAIQYMVFALLFLVLFLNRSASTPRLLQRRNILYLALFAFFTAFQALAAGYYGYYEAILFGLYLLYYWLNSMGVWAWFWGKVRRNASIKPVDWRRMGAQLALLMVAGVAVLAVLVPFLRPYTDFKNQFGFNRSLDEVEYWSAGLLSPLRTVQTSLWYEPVQRGIFGLETSVEREMYPGIIAVALAVVGLVRRQKSENRNQKSEGNSKNTGSPQFSPISRLPGNPQLGAGFFLLVAIVGYILSLGPTLNTDSYGLGSTGIPLPYRWLYQYVPGFDALRVPHRFDLFVMLGLAGCAGFGIVRLVDWVHRRNSRRALFMGGAILALVMLDFFAPGLRSVDVPLGENAPAVYKWLAGSDAAALIPKDSLLLELPVGTDKTPVNTSPQYLLYGLANGRPMLNGSPNIIPAGYERLFSEMRRFPTPGTLDIIEGLGVKYLIVHTGGLLNDDKRAALLEEAKPRGRLEKLEEFPDTWQYPGGSKAEVYRMKPSPERFDKLRAAVPEGASILLADHPAHLRLYNTVLPVLLGPNRRYFANFSTIYDVALGERGISQTGVVYDYAAIYKGDDPVAYGYSAANKVDIGDNDIIDIYSK